MIFKVVIFFIVSIILTACSENRINLAITKNRSQEIWFKQTDVDLGRDLEILSNDFGLAISRGKGINVNGKAYRLVKNKWESFFEFPYSDFPIIKKINKNNILIVIHETHNGNYRPKMFIYNTPTKNISEVDLPKIMWDKKDFSMWKAVDFFENGTGWMVGQIGNLLYFNGKKWIVTDSPLNSLNTKNILSKDLNDVCLLNDGSGWAIGNNGIILRLTNGKWERYNSPVTKDLNQIDASKHTLAIVGKSGTILKLVNHEWIKQPIVSNENLNSVKILSENDIWACGSNSTLIHFNGSNWSVNQSVKMFNDNFNDIDIISDSLKNNDVWIIGDDGIYSTSKHYKFSFTNVTSEVSLQRNGISAIFFDSDNDYFPEVLIRSEKGPNLFYRNESGKNFTETKLYTDNKYSQSLSNHAVDINNDGNNDLILFADKTYHQILLGKGNSQFIDQSKLSTLDFRGFDKSPIPNSIQAADFDNDGNLDLYFSNYQNDDLILQGEGTGKFQKVNITGIENISSHDNHGIVLSDFNGDNRIDIFRIFRLPFENQLGELYLNNGNFSFEKSSQKIFNDNTNPEVYSALANDFNNDGFIDLVLFINNSHLRLLLNDGNAKFEDYSFQSGLQEKIFHPEPSNGVIASADVNNDGYVDLFVGSKLYINNSKTFFTESEYQVGLNFIGNPTFTDYDNDGDIDIYIGSSRNALGAGDRSAIFKNNLNNNNFIKVKIVGSHCNSAAIGTKVHLLGFSNGKLVYQIMKQVGLGANPLTNNDNTFLHFGLPLDLEFKLRIEFSDGSQREIDTFQRGQILVIGESNFPVNIIINVYKNFYRFFAIKDISLEFIKLILFIVTLFFVQKKYLKLGSSYEYLRKYLFILFIIFYLFLVFSSTYNNEVESILIAYGIAFPTNLFFIFLISYLIEKSESKFISHYKLLEVIGVGGMGKVFKALDVNTKKTVALKVINPEILKDEENQRRLSAEGEILSAFQHENIVEVFEIGKSKEHSYIAMEYLAGGTLEDYITKDFPLNLDFAIGIIKQICDGLAAIHEKNVIHRDLKSANIMFDENMRVRIMDFGLSKSPLITTMTTLGTVLGTLGFVAPEQVTSLNVDHRTDIFSFGVILYQMLTKQLPFKGENEIALIHSIFNTNPTSPMEINPQTPIVINKIIKRCLEKNPENRYNSVVEIKEELKDI